MHLRTLPIRRRFGFSYIELLIVVACIAIMAALVMPSAGQDEVARVRAAARLLIADLEYAQTHSMGNGADPCVIVFDADNNAYHIARQSDPDTPITDPITQGPYLTRFGSGRAAALGGVTLGSLTVGDDAALGYTAMGALDQGADASLTLHCGDSSMVIMIRAATGEPFVQ